MSQEIDQRVVEMRFDNAQFEEKSRKTMRTLDKLREKLRFDGAEKGIEKIQQASDEMDFSGMETGLDRVQEKFNALDAVAFTALQNITNKVMDTGERMIRSLSVDQVTSGWGKYVEKTGNVQTIMNATGKSIDQVNGYLNKLMWYSDETSFSFSEMTSAISSAVSTGADLDKVLPMVMGIANAVADAGKGGEAFVHTIRNLTQSYSTGFLQLQDWNSLAIANTNSKALVDSLIEAGKELGTLNAEGRTAKGTLVDSNTFRNTLSEKWATKAVMEKAFGRYAEMTQAVYDAVQSGEYDTASEAIEALSGQYDNLAERSFKAAQQAKSFNEAIDATKDAVSSNWMKIFETIFGNKDEATKTWTELSERLYDIFVPGIEAMNERLQEGLDTGWQQMRRRFGDQADLYATALEKVALSSGAVSEESIEEAGSFAKALEQGKVDAALLGTSLDETIASYEHMLATVSETDPRYSYIQKDYEAFLKLNEAVEDGTLDLGHYADKMSEVSGREHLMQSLWNVWDAIAKVMGAVHDAFTEIFPPTSGEQIHSIAEGLDVVTKKLIISDEAAEKIKMAAKGVFTVLKVGKDILSEVASVVGEIITAVTPLTSVVLNVVSTIGSAVTEVTSGLHPLKELGSWITNFVSSIAPALYSFGASANKTFADFANGAKDALNGLDTDKVNNFVVGGLGAGMLVSIKGFLDSVKSIGTSAIDIVKGIKDCISSLGEAIDAWKQAKKAETLMTIAKAVGIIAASLTVLSMVQPDRLSSSLGAMTTAFLGLLGVMAAMSAISKNVKSLKLGTLAAGMVIVSGAVLILAGALKAISTIEQSNLLSSVAALGGIMAEMTVVAFLLSKFAGRFMKGATGVIAFAAGIRILTSSMQILGAMGWTEIGHGLAAIGGLCAELGTFAAALNNVKFGVLKGTGFVLLATSLNLLAIAFGNFAGMQRGEIGKGLAAIGGALTEFAIVLNFTKGTLGSAASMTIMAASINLLVPAFKGLGALSLTEIGTALLAIGGAFTALGVAAFFLGSVTPVIVALSVSLSALALSIGTLLALSSASAFIGNLAASLSLLRSLNFQVFLNGIKAVAWMLVEFVAGVIKGVGEIAGTLVTSIASIIKAVCDAIVLAAPAISDALYVVGTVVIDTLIRLLAYLWEKSEPALNDLWDKFTAWWSETTKDFNLLDLLQLKWENPLEPFLDELKNGDSFAAGVYQMFAGLGKNAADGFRDGTQNGQDEVDKAAGKMADSAANSTAEAQKSHSPSKVFEELGQYCVEGYALGLENDSMLARVKDAMKNMAVAIREVFTGYWGIHSPSDLAMSDAENILEGYILGIGDKDKRQQVYDETYEATLEVKNAAGDALDEAATTVSTKMDTINDVLRGKLLEMYRLFPRTLNPNDLLANAQYKSDKNALLNATPDYSKAFPGKSGYNLPTKNSLASLFAKWKSGELTAEEAVKEAPAAIKDALKERMSDFVGGYSWKDGFEGLDEALLAQYDKYLTGDNSTTTDPTGTGKGKSSGKGKTAAETIAEKYTKELKANKYLQDAASKEYALWEASEGDTAGIEELIEKKGENLAASIELQTARVDIAQRQYDELLSRVGEDDDKTKDARATLLDEKKELAELQKERYETLYSTAIERYESDDKKAQTEYQLWADTYEKTASVTEKSNRQIEAINKRLAIQSEKTALAEKTWVETKDALGEASVEAQARYLEYLEQMQAEQELQNELIEAELDFYDKMASRYDNQISAAKKRQSLLSTLYNDGDLSGRADAYASAVEEYGADSIEARRAATQGTMTALMGVASAMNNMQFQMNKVTNAQEKYDEVLKHYAADSDEALEAYGDMMDARSTLAGYVGDMADAFNVSDSTKRAMMQVGDALAKNWKNIQNGMNKVLAKVNPQVAESLKNVVGLYMRDGASETMAATANAIVAAMNGDWATAVASGLTAVLDLVGTDFGKTLTEAIGLALNNAFNGNGLFVQLLTQFFGGSGGNTVQKAGNLFSTVLDWGKKLLGLATGADKAFEAVNAAAAAGKTGSGLVNVLNGAGKTAAAVQTATELAQSSGGLLQTVSGVGAKAAGILGSVGTKLTGVLGKATAGIAKVASMLGPHGLLIGAVVAGGALIVSNWDKVKEAVGTAWGWIKEKAAGLWEGVKNVAGGAWNGVKTFVGGAVETGKNIVGGLWNGIKSVASGLWNGVKSVCSGILNGVMSFFGIASPSKVMAGIGVYIGEGLTNGIVSTGSEAEKGMDEVGSAVLDSAHTIGEHIAAFMASDDSAQPTIRPIVDLTEAQRSSAWLSSAFADRQGVIRMSATTTGQMARRSETPARVQNGAQTKTAKPQSNRDVVEAVNALGERIDGISRAVSNMKVAINGRKLVGCIKSDMNEAIGSMT